MAHTLLGDPRAAIAPKRSLCESGQFRAPALHCEQDDLLSLATNRPGGAGCLLGACDKPVVVPSVPTPAVQTALVTLQHQHQAALKNEAGYVTSAMKGSSTGLHTPTALCFFTQCASAVERNCGVWRLPQMCVLNPYWWEATSPLQSDWASGRAI